MNGARADRQPRLERGLNPVARDDTRVLVLGSFPGRASLDARAYYAHRRNAFWPIMATLLERPGLADSPFEHRYAALLASGIGLWDVYAAARRKGSLDAAIRDAEPSDFVTLCRRLPELRALALNGRTAAKAARSALVGHTCLRSRIVLIDLPSTSPAHATLRFDDKCRQWCDALRPFLYGAVARLDPPPSRVDLDAGG